MRTPIDIYRTQNIPSIYVELLKRDKLYSLKTKGLPKDMFLELPDRAICYEIIQSIYDMRPRVKKIIFKDLDTTLTIREHDLVSIMNMQERQKYRDSIKTLAERSRRRFGRIPTKRVKGFKRVNPKTLPPIEKTW
tara:strand:+ start:688 stop:1092 length:405 start_codon:yes stop_codon:yes gene_type:complete